MYDGSDILPAFLVWSQFRAEWQLLALHSTFSVSGQIADDCRLIGTAPIEPRSNKSDLRWLLAIRVAYENSNCNTSRFFM
jgi:hypothetical protein